MLLIVDIQGFSTNFTTGTSLPPVIFPDFLPLNKSSTMTEKLFHKLLYLKIMYNMVTQNIFVLQPIPQPV